MAFCKFSASYIIKDRTSIDNAFIYDFLPYAPEMCVKIYLLGMARCANADAPDNNIENFARILNISEEDVLSAFLYWQELGLVQLIESNPAEVRYLPLSENVGNIKKYKIGKYNDFNLQMQEILNKRMLTPNEYSEYYTLIESYHMQPEALLMIAKYCADYKGGNVGHAYITTVAKNWINEGILTAAAAREKIDELGVLDESIKIVLQALKTKRHAQLEDRQMLNKWMQKMGFDLSVVVYAAKYFSVKKQRIDMAFLDGLMQKYYELKLFSIQEIEDYEQTKEQLYSVAKNIVKNLGLFYEDVTRVVEVYIMPLVSMGYSHQMLCNIANYCFLSNIRTLAGFNATVLKLYKLGIVRQRALDEYLKGLLQEDECIKQVLNELNLVRNVNSYDRTYYDTWTNQWNFNPDIILYGASLACGKQNPMQYLNKILSSWFNAGVHTVEDAKKQTFSFENSSAASEQKLKYTKEQLNSLFANLDEVEF